MAHPQIKFGTDGWRGVIADDFTFANVRTAAEAVAAYLWSRKGAENKGVATEDPALEDPAKGLCIGYDTRSAPKPSPVRVRT